MNMTPNIPGVSASGPVIQQVPVNQVAYDYIPVLRDLLPQFRGIPGYYYLQVEVNNQSRAENEGWLEVANSVTYRVEGPNGSCDCRLYCWGSRIAGADYKSSKRECFVDRDILAATGHKNGSATDLAADPEPETTGSIAAETTVPAASMPPTPPPEQPELTMALCGARGLKGNMGKDAHERRCKKCLAIQSETQQGE